jgi:hypothetical protein
MIYCIIIIANLGYIIGVSLEIYFFNYITIIYNWKPILDLWCLLSAKTHLGMPLPIRTRQYLQ